MYRDSSQKSETIVKKHCQVLNLFSVMYLNSNTTTHKEGITDFREKIMFLITELSKLLIQQINMNDTSLVSKLKKI